MFDLGERPSERRLENRRRRAREADTRVCLFFRHGESAEGLLSSRAEGTWSQNATRWSKRLEDEEVAKEEDARREFAEFWLGEHTSGHYRSLST